ncbi:hypothetical protein HN587_07990 [Candidatus Woesearchaeota archaeon]|jgi:hypothetical protein|nr:hypothetical protein [Candidatus Woesearchaeota archaeon]
MADDPGVEDRLESKDPFRVLGEQMVSFGFYPSGLENTIQEKGLSHDQSRELLGGYMSAMVEQGQSHVLMAAYEAMNSGLKFLILDEDNSLRSGLIGRLVQVKDDRESLVRKINCEQNKVQKSIDQRLFARAAEEVDPESSFGFYRELGDKDAIKALGDKQFSKNPMFTLNCYKSAGRVHELLGLAKKLLNREHVLEFITSRELRFVFEAISLDTNYEMDSVAEKEILNVRAIELAVYIAPSMVYQKARARATVHQTRLTDDESKLDLLARARKAYAESGDDPSSEFREKKSGQTVTRLVDKEGFKLYALHLMKQEDRLSKSYNLLVAFSQSEYVGPEYLQFAKELVGSNSSDELFKEHGYGKNYPQVVLAGAKQLIEEDPKKAADMFGRLGVTDHDRQLSYLFEESDPERAYRLHLSGDGSVDLEFLTQVRLKVFDSKGVESDLMLSEKDPLAIDLYVESFGADLASVEKCYRVALKFGHERLAEFRTALIEANPQRALNYHFVFGGNVIDSEGITQARAYVLSKHPELAQVGDDNLVWSMLGRQH